MAAAAAQELCLVFVRNQENISETVEKNNTMYSAVQNDDSMKTMDNQGLMLDTHCHMQQPEPNDSLMHHMQPAKVEVALEQAFTEEQPPPAPAPPVKSEPVKNTKKDRKRETIDGQAREIIFKIIKFFESEKHNRGYAYPVENVMKRASAATGLSESTIKRIKRDGIKAEATNTKIPGPKKKRTRKTKIQLDYYQLCALRGIVNSYSSRKEVPTLNKILAAARSELSYQGGKESLRLILLNKLGIKFKKCEKKEKKPLPEQKPQVMTMQQPQPMITNNIQIHPPMQNPMMHQHMHPMKMEEQHCAYNNLMPQTIGLQ